MIFGGETYEAELVRYYMEEHVKRHWLGRHVFALYCRYGPWAANKAETTARWNRPLSALFYWLFWRATNVVAPEKRVEFLNAYYAARCARGWARTNHGG